MTALKRSVLILVLPAYALGAVFAGVVLGLQSLGRLWVRDWREAAR